MFQLYKNSYFIFLTLSDVVSKLFCLILTKLHSMNKIIVVSFSIVCILLHNNCGKKTTTPAFSPTCDSEHFFNKEVLPLMKSYCVSCHSNYNSYSQVNSSASSIRSSIMNGSMPRGGTLTDDQKNAIICWIDAGAKNN